MEKLLNFLRYFKDITDQLQKDSSLIYLVFLTFKRLNEAIINSTFNDKNFNREISKHLKKKLVYARQF